LTYYRAQFEHRLQSLMSPHLSKYVEGLLSS
jgi:hypothetical protein